MKHRSLLSLDEATAWLDIAEDALIANPNDRDRFAWVQDAKHALARRWARRSLVRQCMGAARFIQSQPAPSQDEQRDAHVLCFLAAVLRAVGDGR